MLVVVFAVNETFSSKKAKLYSVVAQYWKTIVDFVYC